MTPQPPSLAEQIMAVEWAENHLDAMGKAAHMRASEIETFEKALRAALETLRTLEFARGTLR